MGIVAGAAYAKLAYSAKAREEKPINVPFSDLEAVKSDIKLYAEEKERRIKSFSEFSKKRIDSKYNVTLGNLALLQQEKDRIADVMSKLNVKTDMPRILTLKEMLEAINIQADADVNFFRAIKTFKEKKEKETKEAGKPTSIPSKPIDARTLPNVEVEKIPVKSASEVANQISVAFKAPILATVALKKGLKEAGEQSKQTFTNVASDASKASMSLTTISNTGAIIGKTIAQSIESGTGALKAVLKKILTMLLDCSDARWSPPLRWAPSQTLALVA